jgi:hypothetical protein
MHLIPALDITLMAEFEAVVTSIPTCRKTLRAEKIDRYFDLKHLKICAHLNIFYIFLYVVFHGHYSTP